MATTLRNFDNHELKIYWATVRERVTFSHARVGKWVLDLIKKGVLEGWVETPTVALQIRITLKQSNSTTLSNHIHVKKGI
jgi:hypothetical protein